VVSPDLVGSSDVVSSPFVVELSDLVVSVDGVSLSNVVSLPDVVELSDSVVLVDGVLLSNSLVLWLLALEFVGRSLISRGFSSGFGGGGGGFVVVVMVVVVVNSVMVVVVVVVVNVDHSGVSSMSMVSMLVFDFLLDVLDHLLLVLDLLSELEFDAAVSFVLDALVESSL